MHCQFTTDCTAAPVALTNERPIILWGVSRLMAAAAAHSPAHDLAPPSEGAGGGWKKISRQSDNSGTISNRVCCPYCVFYLFSVKVCPRYKTHKNSKETGKPAGVRYVHKLSIPRIQFRSVPDVDGVFRAQDDDTHIGSRVYYSFLPVWDEI